MSFAACAGLALASGYARAEDNAPAVPPPPTATGKPILYFVHMEACGACAQMDWIRNDPVLSKMYDVRYVLATQEPETNEAGRLGLDDTRIPNFTIASPDGKTKYGTVFGAKEEKDFRDRIGVITAGLPPELQKAMGLKGPLPKPISEKKEKRIEKREKLVAKHAEKKEIREEKRDLKQWEKEAKKIAIPLTDLEKKGEFADDGMSTSLAGKVDPSAYDYTAIPTENCTQYMPSFKPADKTPPTADCQASCKGAYTKGYGQGLAGTRFIIDVEPILPADDNKEVYDKARKSDLSRYSEKRKACKDYRDDPIQLDCCIKGFKKALPKLATMIRDIPGNKSADPKDVACWQDYQMGTILGGILCEVVAGTGCMIYGKERPGGNMRQRAVDELNNPIRFLGCYHLGVMFGVTHPRLVFPENKNDSCSALGKPLREALGPTAQGAVDDNVNKGLISADGGDDAKAGGNAGTADGN